jgi:ankyrin repeat protein
MFLRRLTHYSIVVANQAAVRWCLDREADPNGISVYGMTVLHYAARNASLSTLKLILDAGGDISPTSPSSGILVHAVASYHKRPDRRPIIEYLIDRVDVDALFMKPKHGHKRSEIPWAGHQTALHLAVRDGERDLVAYLLNHGASTQLRVFGMATRYKWMSVVNMADSNGHGDLRGLLEDSIPRTTEPS